MTGSAKRQIGCLFNLGFHIMFFSSYCHEAVAMKCNELPEVTIHERIAEFEDAANLNRHETHRPVWFHFDLDREQSRGGTFVLRSEVTRMILYAGPYAPRIQVAAPEVATADGGWDLLSFIFLSPGSNVQCLWTTDQAYPFWGREHAFSVRLMMEPAIDEHGMVRDYDVTLMPEPRPR